MIISTLLTPEFVKPMRGRMGSQCHSKWMNTSNLDKRIKEETRPVRIIRSDFEALIPNAALLKNGTVKKVVQQALADRELGSSKNILNKYGVVITPI